MGACVGCYRKPVVVTTTDLPSNELQNQGTAESVKRPTSSEDFWTTSTHDIDNSIGQSQRSMSSIGTTNLPVALPSASKTSNPEEFVNHGLILWNQTRQRWVGDKRPENRSQQSREPKLRTHCLCLANIFWLCSWNATYESLLGTSKPFRQPVSLAEMVDFLVEVWEQEGLYD
ncbi:uncharacterized protein LOC107618619 isoform X1 [Arachis ipaensis]|uniref:uncharacterized protein LOC107618619 isoform X1 n=1 Tax=Arachis ipaensis TaxID=130454 RepID=UPI000A2B14EA|nr:uncharacterized protein LOC107618619 isoform X1 [Arachis ipaensis]XP_020967153.1 uncharacterized protein LOC107618619 isoform X1 [Arachis ipaensis]XP_020967154.1 uncharacterized protein LOC107618619 isoform X1 [Arachis ipaensis]XP_020967155.1 uncharacterized protein LOC107618619 isoform X1 [Arachis ipaensis]XP_029151829.1 uncharacterized protein LOC112779259 isoform X1 [Arachis hypogaea]XP_029151830.1 uncharacterized protein LOC112779259 isoform X1 [Arachis hypogaea]